MSRLSNIGSITVAASTVLAQQASTMTAGEIRNLSSVTGGLGSTSFWTDQYQIQQLTSNFYYDSVNREFQVMGKPASGQSTSWGHYVYDEVQNTWTRTTNRVFQSGTTSGHCWNHAFDPATGDYYFIVSASNLMNRWVRSSWVANGKGTYDAWVTTSTASGSILSTSYSGWGGIGWHPNLFGSGDGGVVVRGGANRAGWRKSTDSWQFINNVGGTNLAAHDGGGRGLYYSDTDKLILGTGATNTAAGPMESFDAGSGGSIDTTPTTLGVPPVQICGAASGQAYGHIMKHPDGSDRLLLLHRNGNLYVSTNRAVSWSSSGTHPLNGVLGDSWVACALPDHNACVWGISSGTGGAAAGTYLWKPNV